MATSTERWDKAIRHAREMLEIYKEIPTGVFGALLIQNAISRYENGERTKYLLVELEGIK